VTTAGDRSEPRRRGSIRTRGGSLQVRVYAGQDPVTRRDRCLSETIKGTDRAARRKAEKTLTRLQGRGNVDFPFGTRGGLLAVLGAIGSRAAPRGCGCSCGSAGHGALRSELPRRLAGSPAWWPRRVLVRDERFLGGAVDDVVHAVGRQGGQVVLCR
jgi:hypothetical protein